MAKGSNPLTSKSNSSLGSQGSNKKATTGWKNIQIKAGGALKSPKSKPANNTPLSPQQAVQTTSTTQVEDKSLVIPIAPVSSPPEEKPKPRELSFVLSALRDSINEQEEKERQKKLGKVAEMDEDDEDDDDDEIPTFPTPPIPSLDETQFIVQEEKTQSETKPEIVATTADTNDLSEKPKSESEEAKEQKEEKLVENGSKEEVEKIEPAAPTSESHTGISQPPTEPTPVSDIPVPEQVKESNETAAPLSITTESSTVEVSEPSSPVPDPLPETPINGESNDVVASPEEEKPSNLLPATAASVIPASSAAAYENVMSGSIDKDDEEVVEEHNMAEYMSPPTPGAEPSPADQQFRREMEDDAMESEGSSSTTFSLPPIDLKAVKPNFLTPREQEEYGIYIISILWETFRSSPPISNICFTTNLRFRYAEGNGIVLQQQIYEGKSFVRKQSRRVSKKHSLWSSQQ
jgi:hypothetical protein